MAAKGVQVLLHPLSADRPRGDRRRTNGRPASAARCAHQSSRALYREDRDRGGLLQRRRRTRHPAIPHRLRRKLYSRRSGQAIQSACDDRRCNRETRLFRCHRTVGLANSEKDARSRLDAKQLPFTPTPECARRIQLVPQEHAVQIHTNQKLDRITFLRERRSAAAAGCA
jgi:hypothetical protein